MIPVIKKIARTIARRANDPVEDLVQAGAIGLLKAIDSYSEEISENFRIYAGYLIIGEMKHYLRDKLNTIRVPRHIQELVYRINSFTRSLTAEEMNELTNDDVAGVLKISSTAVDFALLADRRRSTLSLEELYNYDPESLTYEEVLYNFHADSPVFCILARIRPDKGSRNGLGHQRAADVRHRAVRRQRRGQRHQRRWRI